MTDPYINPSLLELFLDPPLLLFNQKNQDLASATLNACIFRACQDIKMKNNAHIMRIFNRSKSMTFHLRGHFEPDDNL